MESPVSPAEFLSLGRVVLCVLIDESSSADLRMHTFWRMWSSACTGTQDPGAEW